MASLILKMSVSLDGHVASRDGNTDWLAAGRSDDSTGWVLETVSNAAAHLIGAATYAAWAGYWPGASGPFAKAMNEIPKVVFSNSLTSTDWGETEIAAGDLAAAITRLKQERSSDRYLLAQGGHGSPDRLSRPAWSTSTALSSTRSSWAPASGSSPHRSPSNR